MAQADDSHTTSRRSFLAGAAALPAIAGIAALAEASPPAPDHPDASSTPGPVTLIGRLGAERERVIREAKDERGLVRELNDELERLMPKPHPSIVFCADNDADGLNYSARGHSPHTIHHYIYSNLIEEKLKNVEPTNIERITVDGCQAFVVRNEPMPLPPERMALKERLTARLELSQKYERKIKRTKSKIGLTAAYKALDKLTAQQLDLEQQIMSTRCAARSDFAVKLAIYDLHCRDDVDAEAILMTSDICSKLRHLTTALDFAASRALQLGRLRPPLSFAAAGIMLLIRNRSQQTVR